MVTYYYITLWPKQVINHCYLSQKSAQIPSVSSNKDVDNVWMTVERFFLSALSNFRIFVWKLSTFGVLLQRFFYRIIVQTPEV